MMQLRSEQDSASVGFMLNLCKQINAKVYMEIGCAQLGTLDKFRQVLPEGGWAIGVDRREYDNWEGYRLMMASESQSPGVWLSERGENRPVVREQVTNIITPQPVDFLFIDGDHNIEPTQADWDNYSPLVRPGGIIAFHDFDAFAYNRGVKEGQGAAWVCASLHRQGYEIEKVPIGCIGIAFVRQK